MTHSDEGISYDVHESQVRAAYVQRDKLFIALQVTSTIGIPLWAKSYT